MFSLEKHGKSIASDLESPLRFLRKSTGLYPSRSAPCRHYITGEVKVNGKPATTNVASNYLQARSQAHPGFATVTIKPF